MTDKFISVEAIAKRYPGASGGQIAVFENLWLSMARGEFGCVIAIPAAQDHGTEHSRRAGRTQRGDCDVDGQSIEAPASTAQ